MSFTMVPVKGRFLREGTACTGYAEFEPSAPLRDTATGEVVSGVRRVDFDGEGYLGAPAGAEFEALDDPTTLPAPDGDGNPTVFWIVRLFITGDTMREYVLYLYAADAGAGVQLATRLDGVAARPLYPYVLLPVYVAHVAQTIAEGAHGGLAALAIPALSDDAPVADATPAGAGTSDEASRSDHRHPLSGAYATAQALADEAQTRSDDDDTLGQAISDEASARATADGLRLLKAQNLADVADVATARSNLGAAAAADLTTETTNRTNGDLRPIEAGFSSDGSVYLTFPYAATLAAPTATPGVAALSYAISTAATPTVFGACVFPQAFAVGDTIRVTAAGVVTFETTRMQRTA